MSVKHFRKDASYGLSLSDTPTTQASADSASEGTGVRASRIDHKHGMPTITDPGLTRAGGNTSEATTTSTSAVDLVTVSSLNIAVTSPVEGFVNMRKTPASFTVNIGLKVNTTVVSDPTTATTLSFLGGTGSVTNQAEECHSRFWISPRSTNYLATWGKVNASYISSSGAQLTSSTSLTSASPTSAFPNATITDVIIRGIASNASITLGVQDIGIYVLAVS